MGSSYTEDNWWLLILTARREKEEEEENNHLFHDTWPTSDGDRSSGCSVGN